MHISFSFLKQSSFEEFEELSSLSKSKKRAVSFGNGIENSTLLCTIGMYYNEIKDALQKLIWALENGENPKERDINNATPIGNAIAFGYYECVTVLFAHGANPNITQHNILPVFSLIQLYNRKQKQEGIQTLEFLLEQNCKLECVSKGKQVHIVDYVTSYTYIEMIEILLKHKHLLSEIQMQKLKQIRFKKIFQTH